MPAQSTTKPLEFEGRGCRLVPRGLSPTAPPGSRPLGARASRPHPIPANSLPSQGHSLARRTKPAFTGISSIVPGFVRARRPRSRGVFVRAGRPRSQGIFTPSPFPTLADPSRVFSNALVALRRPSCPFVEYSFLSVRASSSYYSSNCRTLLRILSRLVLAISRVGSRERARSRLRTASSVRPR